MPSRSRRAAVLVTVLAVVGSAAAVANAPSAEVIVDVFGLPAPPAPPPKPPIAERAKTTFAARCAQCHGATGRGDGPVAKTLQPRPRNFALAAWQRQVDDARIAKVIQMGGVGVGMSPLMPPHPDLTGDTLAEMIALLRSFEEPAVASVFLTLERPNHEAVANKRVRLKGASLRARFKKVAAGDLRVVGFVDLDGDAKPSAGEPTFETDAEPCAAGAVSKRAVRLPAPKPSADAPP